MEKVPATADEFFEIVTHRRTYYNITKESTLSDEKLHALVEKAVAACPTAFDNLATRAAVVTGETNVKVWNAQLDELKKMLPPGEMLERQQGQIENVFRVGYGSVILAYDNAVVEHLNKIMPGVPHEPWLGHSSGMLQFMVWTALCAEGMGASLQHHVDFGAAVNEAVLETAGLPKTWKITAILPFGVPSGGPSKPERPVGDLAERVKLVKG